MKPTKENMMKVIQITSDVFGLKPRDVLSGKSQVDSDARKIALHSIDLATGVGASAIARHLGMNVSTVGVTIRSAVEITRGSDKFGMEMKAKLHQVMGKITPPEYLPTVTIEVVHGVARVLSKPDNVSVVINHKLFLEK